MNEKQRKQERNIKERKKIAIKRKEKESKTRR